MKKAIFVFLFGMFLCISRAESVILTYDPATKQIYQVVGTEGRIYMPDGSIQFGGSISLLPVSSTELFDLGIPPDPFGWQNSDLPPTIPCSSKTRTITINGATITYDLYGNLCGPARNAGTDKNPILYCQGTNSNLCYAKNKVIVGGETMGGEYVDWEAIVQQSGGHYEITIEYIEWSAANMLLGN